MKRKWQRLKIELETADIEIIHAMVWLGVEEIKKAQKQKVKLMREALQIPDDDTFLLVTGLDRDTAKRCYGTE